MWGSGHTVGYCAQAVGPSLSGVQSDRPPSGGQLRLLHPGQTIAFDGFFSWPLERNGAKGTKTVSVEKMAVVNDGGAQ